MCNSSKSDIKPIDMIKNQSFTDQLNVALTSNSIAMPIISNITYTHINGANEHNNSYDVTAVIKSNSKSIYNLSTDLKNDIENVYSLCNNVNKHTLNLKESILDCEAFIKDLSRYNFNLSSSHNNIQIDLKKANDSTNALKELLIKLENLSVITTHLANKTTLEKTYTQTNNDVLDFISKEFNSYANEIRRAIIQMSSIFNDFEKSYAQCNNEIKHNGDLIASYGLTLKQFNNTLTDITHNLNCIVRSTDSIDTTITRSKINTRHLVADASELRANVSHFAKTSYSISKLSK
ncbi:MAG: hypothetical protein E7262_08330 [Lachnospiraceae bacterium]|nr:hypothetical protein [Lachnospiraceae bacterium]